MKLFVENNEVTSIKITDSKNKVIVEIMTIGGLVLIRPEVGVEKSRFTAQFPRKEEVLFLEYMEE